MLTAPHRQVFDNGRLLKTELLPSAELQPLDELLELPDFLAANHRFLG